jgi:hypothetical protein
VKRAATLLLACMSLAVQACGRYGPPVRTHQTLAPAAASPPATDPASEATLDPPEAPEQTPDEP